MIKLSTLHKKQIIGVTGLGMVLFVLAHLTGNFLIFKSADAFNNYAKFLQNLGALLWFLRIGLIVSFILHIGFTLNLVISNKKARKKNYYKYENHTKESSLSIKLMPYTGTIMMIYIVFHLFDFTFAEKTGLINNIDYGLYGLVINVLGNPIHSILYIIAMISVGSHTYHGFQSVFQTFGIMTVSTQKKFSIISKCLGIGVTIGYSLIPIYILFAF